MRRMVFLVLSLSLLVPSLARADDGLAVDWSSVSFGSLDDPFTAIQVRTIVRGLVDGDSAFVELLESERRWSCIARIVDDLRDADSAVFGNGSTGAPEATPDMGWTEDAFGDSLSWDEMRNRFFEHSGRSWAFWSEVVHSGKLVHELGFPMMPFEDSERLFTEIESAFGPFLDAVMGKGCGGR